LRKLGGSVGAVFSRDKQTAKTDRKNRQKKQTEKTDRKNRQKKQTEKTDR